MKTLTNIGFQYKSLNILEMVGYNGPIYMTVPTKAIAPILLEDMRKVAVDRKGMNL